MRFVVDKLTKSGRLCHLELEKLEFQTPLLLLYTRVGSIPHISKEVFDDCFDASKEIFLVSAGSTFLMQKSCEAFGSGIMDFAGYKNSPCFMSVKDIGDENSFAGHKETNAMGLHTRTGKVVVNSAKYMKLIEAMKPNFYEILCDGETNAETSKKRAVKAVDRTQNFFEECKKINLDIHHRVAVVEGGFVTEERERAVNFLKTHEDDFEGFSIDGFHSNGASAATLNIPSIESIVNQVVASLPDTKLRIMYGAYNPLTVLHLVKLGIDLFDSTYAYLATQAHYALTFNFSDAPFAINLTNIDFKEDFSPLLEGCECLACRKHTRAYIYHLVNCKELLAATLLMIHNLHHYKEFFVKIRNAVESEHLDILIETMEKTYEPLKLEMTKDETKKEKFGRFNTED